MKLLHRQTPAMAVTHVTLILPLRGCALDPADRQGLSRLMLRMLFVGADGLGNAEFNARLERLGATAGASLHSDYWALRLTSLTSHLDEAMGLFLGALQRPNMDREEFSRLREELVSGWLAERDESKRTKAREVYMHGQYGGQPNGFQPDGTVEGMQTCTLEDVVAHHTRLRGQAEPILAVLSDLPRAEVESRVAGALAPFAGGPPGADSATDREHPWAHFAPPSPSGRAVTIVDDPGTNTDEVVLGAFSTHPLLPDWHLHRMLSFIFGGDMNSRLFRIIRGERGLSYGASCWYEAAGGNLPRNHIAPFTMYTFPSADKSAEAIPLIIQLYEELVEKGVTEEEIALARSALINSYPFRWDSPQKQLSLDVEEALYGYRLDDAGTHRAMLEAATQADLLRVLRETHHPGALRMVLLGDPARLEPIARALPGVENITRVCYP